MDHVRQRIAEHMVRSKATSPHVASIAEAEMTRIVRYRESAKEPFERAEGYKLTYTPFFAMAVVRALKEFPFVNASIEGSNILVKRFINIGMAVALEEGLVVPVIRNADRLSLAELARQTRELAEKAQKKKLFPLDYEGGTFTVSNLGMFGVDAFIAIINPPQCAILAIGQIAPRVVPHGEGIAVRSLMTMTLSADHRVIDGAIGARFLGEVKGLLETPV